MPRDHFKKVFFSPYFRTEHYYKNTADGKLEQKIETFLKRIFKRKRK